MVALDLDDAVLRRAARAALALEIACDGIELAVENWRAAIDSVYPYRSWVPVDATTLERLARLKAERGLPTFSAAVDGLLDEAER